MEYTDFIKHKSRREAALFEAVNDASEVLGKALAILERAQRMRVAA